ncbi:MAG: DUF3775 domain-containing protein [Proteobacteria bacterium]|nr:DUF3775 domain-containing protein [Pseudomonadota bacterium]
MSSLEGTARPGKTGLSLDALAYIVLKARVFDAQAGVSDPDDGSNPADDREVSILEGSADDATAEELAAAINELTEEAQIELVALAWVGRGDFGGSEWPAAKRLARDRRRGSTARYLIGMPQLGDYLEEGAAALGISLVSQESRLLDSP